MLGGKKLQEAIDEQTARQLAIFRQMGKDGVEALKGMTSVEADAVLAANPLSNYDIDVLLRAGVIAWSYDEKLTPQALGELDEETRTWAATEILKLSKPSLFEPPEEIEKNS